MDFTAVGKVGSYLKQKNLMFAANYKIKTGQRLTDENGNLNFTKSTMFDQIREASKKSAEEVKAARLASIKQKLMNGEKLSDEEMGFLRVNDTDLYKKAQHAEDAREELKAELKGAKTKQEAREILTRAMVKASAEASAEIAACKAGVSTSGGISFSSGGNVSVSGDMSVSVNTSSALNISVGDISATTENISIADGVATSTENVSVADNSQNANKNLDSNKTFEENNFRADSISDSGKDTPEGILEKFIMTIRALEDEWQKFTHSDKYKDLPEDYFQDEKVYKVADVPDRKVLNAIVTYRNSAFNQSKSYNLLQQDTKNIFNSSEVDLWKNITLQS